MGFWLLGGFRVLPDFKYALDCAVLDAKKRAPFESVGLLCLRDGVTSYHSCENISKTPLFTFEISDDEFIDVSEVSEIVGVVHSHPKGRLVLSGADRKAQIASNIDWYLIVDEKIKRFRPCPPLLGREFTHGQHDCYSLFRDAYMLSGVDFPDFERREQWWEGEEELYLQNMKKHGFYQVDEPALGDVILMQLKSDRANHSAIYLEDMLILHHTPNRLSKRDLYAGFWQKHTHSIWRYEKWQLLDFTAISNDSENSLTSM